MGWILLACILIAAALVVLWAASRSRAASGLPAGRVIYQDTNRWSKVEKPLYDPISGLTGKPDYLVMEQDIPIPVEVKSGRAPATPHDSHVFQLAAYCLLVERTTGKRPPYGILRYRDATFSIPYSDALRDELEDLMADMRAHKQKEVHRSHNEPARCARCGFRNVCDQRL